MIKKNNKWTNETIANEALKYNSRQEFKNNNNSAYRAAIRLNILDKISNHMKSVMRWNEESIKTEALLYNSKSEFQKKSPGAYAFASKRKILNQICSHMESPKTLGMFLTKEKLKEEADKYKTRKEFKTNNPKAYRSAIKQKILREICLHMEDFSNCGRKWTIEEVKLHIESKNYKLLSDEYKNNSSLLLIRCEKGHEYNANFANFLRNRRCAICKKKKKRTIEEALNIFGQKNYKVVSEEIKTVKNNLQVLCPNNHEWSISLDNFLKGNTCPYCNLSGTSKTELKILDWIKTYYENASKTKILDFEKRPVEVDIFIKELKLGIEYNGLYWHNESKGHPKRAKYKLDLANKNGIRLITIFEDEWIYRESQVKNFLLSVLGKNERNFYARKTQLREVPKDIAKEFLDDNHIQGSCRFEIAYGLYFNEELLAVITGNKHHRQGHSSTFVLNRLAFKHNTSVVGGSSKLLKALLDYAKSKGYVELLSWSDNRWSEGNVYEKLGFILKEELPTDYSYVLGQTRISKQSCQKKHLQKKGGIGNTEKEMAASLGLYRIWDCGKKAWSINLSI